jgi:hypothetical protein
MITNIPISPGGPSDTTSDGPGASSFQRLDGTPFALLLQKDLKKKQTKQGRLPLGCKFKDLVVYMMINYSIVHDD